MRQLRDSPNGIEGDIYRCVVQNLFNEFPVLSNYDCPEKELKVLGVFFGQLVQHQLLNRAFLAHALRLVIEAIKRPPQTNANMFRFGVFALEQFIPQLGGLPQYRNYLLQIQTLKSLEPALYRHLETLGGGGGGAL